MIVLKGANKMRKVCKKGKKIINVQQLFLFIVGNKKWLQY